MQDIQPGEEICFDYARHTAAYDEFECGCGAPDIVAA
jgi:SET domain-containing protein